MLVIQDLDGATVERAGALVAREHAAARQMRPELPAEFDSARFCAAVRHHPAGGQYARLPAEGFAVDPDLADPTGSWPPHSGTSRRR